MEKKTILAFILSFIVLIAWSYLYGPKQEQAVKKEEGIQRESKEALPESAKAPVFKPSVLGETDQRGDRPDEQVIRDREIKVETPLYRVIFSNRGATIKSFKLKEYHLTKELNSPLIELVNLQDRNDDFFSAHFESQSVPVEKKAVYSINEEYLSLSTASSPRDLTFKHLRPDGISIHQTFRFYPDRYDIDLLITLTNNSESQVGGNIRTNLKNLPPKEKSSYYSFVGIALLLNDELEEIKPKKMEEDKILSGRIGWMAYENDYFISAVIPENKKDGSFKGRVLPTGIIDASYTAPSIVLKPLEQSSSRLMLYMGPREVDMLKNTGKKLDQAINFGFFDIIAKPLHFALRYFNRYIHNYGVSIIILTILIKIIFWPLTHKSYKSMKEMQKLQPLMAKIREKYKNDKQQMQKELMGLYKTYKINPMGGCLPMVIQIPVFFALFRILGNSIELRHAPFLFWITDLSAPDRLFNLPFSIPFMSPPYGIPVLTLLMGASMFIQQKMTPTPGDPAQAKIMMFLPIVFTVMFINFPSGLVLYWLTNNILSIGQQYRIKKSPG
ncbi:membrane protein insertase YidC [Thermodesulfobacteriota bacterium]